MDPGAAGYDGPAPQLAVLATEVRACISQPSETRNTDGADEVNDYSLMCDPVAVGLTQYDYVIDEMAGVTYEVRKASKSVPVAFGLQHLKATIREAKGLIDESVA